MKSINHTEKNLTPIKTSLLNNILSIIVFTEPKHKSNHRGYNKKEVSGEECLKSTQSTNIRERKGCIFLSRRLLPVSNVDGVKQSSPRLLFTIQPPLGHQTFWNTRLTALKKNISGESGEVQLPNLVKKRDYDTGS